jgi:hypothetical protein
MMSIVENLGMGDRRLMPLTFLFDGPEQAKRSAPDIFKVLMEPVTVTIDGRERSMPFPEAAVKVLKQSSRTVNYMQNVAGWPRLPRKANSAPECGSCARTSCAKSASPSKPRRMSVAP